MDTYEDVQSEYRKNCTTCRLFVKGSPYGNKKIDRCKYTKQYLNSYIKCKYYTDVNGPSVNFRKELGKGHTRGKGFATFD